MSVGSLVLFPSRLLVGKRLGARVLGEDLCRIGICRSRLALGNSFDSRRLVGDEVSVKRLRFSETTVYLGLASVHNVDRRVDVAFKSSICMFRPKVSGEKVSGANMRTVTSLSRLGGGGGLPCRMGVGLGNSRSVGFVPLNGAAHISLGTG